MKKLVLIVLMSFAATAAFATSLHPDTFKPSYTVFKSIAADSVESRPLCPDGVTCIVDGTVVELTYSVACTEKIVSFTHEAKEIGNELHVFVSAVVGSNNSNGPQCLGISLEQKQFTYVNSYGEVVLHNLGVQQLQIENQ